MLKRLLQAWRRAISEARAQARLEKLTTQGLDMDLLKQLARENEKFIRVTLADGAVIEIWREQDRPEANPLGPYW